jgi:AraC-like DNA-binding protein
MNTTIYESVKKSIEFIEANLLNDISVLDVANSVSYSQFYFSREFSRHTNISIYDYILRRKISESYKNLFQSDCKIVDLAFRYGFQSHEVFTRAFRKMFGENPSEAIIYKPFTIYEAIDEQYLDFLYALRVEVINEFVPDCFFEADTAADLDSDGNLLVQLSRHLLGSKSIFTGSVMLEKSKLLSYEISNLKHEIRIHHNNTKLSFRYYIDNFYDSNKMESNYILIKKEKDYIDIIIPSRA